jgi:hypothetical protein
LTRLLVALALGAAASTLIGCASPAPSEPARAASRMIRDADSDDALLAAKDVLQREFGRVTSDRQSGSLRTTPVEVSSDETTRGGPRDLLRPTRLRKQAWCAVTPREGGAMVRLRVDVERQEVRRQPAFSYDSSRRGDSPGTFSAIEEDAATTPEQNSNWVFVERDSRLERSLLDRIEDFFVPAESSTSTQAVFPSSKAAGE